MKLRNTYLASTSIFSALVGPRPVMAPEDGAGGGAGEAAGGAAGGDAAPASTEIAPDANAATSEATSALAGYKTEGEANPAEGGEDKERGKDGDAASQTEDGKSKSAGADAADDSTPKDIDGKPVPEAYELKMPDGIEMDAALLAEVTPMFREAKLSPAQAQVVADAYMKTQTDAIQKFQEQTQQWLKDAKADDEIGKADYDKNLSHAHRAFKAFGNDKAMQLFDSYGLGNHPEILRIFVRMGKAIGEGGTVLSGEASQRVSDGQALYPNMYK